MDTLEEGASTRSRLNAAERRILVICFLTAMIDGFDTLILAFIAPLVGKVFGLSPVEIGKLFAINFIGAVIGGLGFGPLADRFGRRAMLLVSLALAVVFTLLCSLAGSPQELMALRFLAGLGFGGVIPMIIALTAESMPLPLRTASVTWMFLGIPLGAVVGGAIVAATLSYGWQAIFVGGGVVAALLIPAVFFGIPESLVTSAALAPTDAKDGLFASVPAQFAEGRFASVLCLWLGAFSVILPSFFLLNWMPSVLVGSGFSAGARGVRRCAAQSRRLGRSADHLHRSPARGAVLAGHCRALLWWRTGVARRPASGRPTGDERLIQKLEIDKEILADQEGDANEEAANWGDPRRKTIRR
jgi:MFS transporter, AAHS family, 4-hydroxybenzoate transporter